GLLAKEMVVTLPAVLLLVDLVRRPVLGGRRLVFHSLLWLVALTSTAVTLSTPGLVASQEGGGGLAVIYNASLYVVRYLELLVFPVSQSIDYSYAAITESSGLFSPPAVVVSMLLVLGLVLLSVWAYRRGRGVLGLAILWFLGTLVPVLQFVPIAEQFAEHFVYLPSIGIALLAGYLLLQAWKWNQFYGGAIAKALVILLVVLTVRRNGDWDTRESLYASAVREQPQCARAHFEYGNALIDSTVLGSLAGSLAALVMFDRALEIWQNRPLETYLGYKLRIHAQRGLIYSVLGEKSPARLRDSIREFRLLFSQRDSDGKELAKSTQPVLLGLRRQLASCLERAGDLDEALLEYRKVIELAGDSGDALAARFQVHQILMNRKEFDEAIWVLEEIIEVAGRKKTASAESLNAQLYLFTILLEHKKDFDSAEALIEGLLRAAADDGQKVGFLLRWAQVFDRQGNLDACVAKLEEALQIDPASVAVLESIAPIESKRNRKEKAEEYFRRLLQVNPGNSIALQGLRELKVRKDAGPARGVKELEARKVLESMEETARGHEQKKQWPAARQSWAHIAEKAAEVGEGSKLAEAYRGLARAEVYLVRPRQALGYLEKALALGAGRTETLLALGDLYFGQIEEPARAEDYYRQYLEALGPAGKAAPGAYLNLARLVSARSALDSIEFYEKAAGLGILDESGPSTAEIEKEMGLLYTKLGLWKQAFDMLSKYHKGLGADKADERRDIEEILNIHVLPKLLGDEKKKTGSR
ncbi:MAG: tetratricopeptide repeat protein, partial [Planctomycetota bacterium]